MSWHLLRYRVRVRTDGAVIWCVVVAQASDREKIVAEDTLHGFKSNRRLVRPFVLALTPVGSGRRVSGRGKKRVYVGVRISVTVTVRRAWSRSRQRDTTSLGSVRDKQQAFYGTVFDHGACGPFLAFTKSNSDAVAPSLSIRLRRVALSAFLSLYSQNLNDDNRATAVFDVDTDKAHDHRAILERNAKIGEMIEKGELEAGIYRGQGAHRVYAKRREGALSSAKTTGLYGPVRGTNNVRMTMYVDYNPEICKDYKETGYCGFGNTCKFMHDRHDYKGGWQIDKEWEEMQKKRQVRLVLSGHSSARRPISETPGWIGRIRARVSCVSACPEYLGSVSISSDRSHEALYFGAIHVKRPSVQCMWHCKFFYGSRIAVGLSALI